MTKKSRAFLDVVNFCTVALIAVVEILIPLLEGEMLKAITIRNSDLSLLWLTVLLIVFNALLYFILNKCTVKKQSAIVAEISSNTIRKVSSFCQKAIQQNGANFYTEFLERGPSEISALVSPDFLFFIFYGIMAVIAIVITIQWTLSLFIIFPFALLLYFTLEKYFNKRLNKMAEKISDLAYEKDPEFITYIKNAQTISRFGNSKIYLKNFDDFQKENYALSKKFLIAKEMKNGLTELISTLSFILLISILCFDLINNRTNVAQIVVTLAYFNLIILPISYFNSYRMLLLDAEYSKDLYQNINTDYEQELEKYSNITFTSDTDIKIKNVNFSFAEQSAHDKEEQMDYKNISFTISKGESLSMIGLSGEGKSTIIKLLLGELKPNSGTIELAGLEVSRTPPQIVHHLICVYEQTPTIFPTDLYENICLGRKMMSADEIAKFFETYKAEFSDVLYNKKISPKLCEVFDIFEKPSEKEIRFLNKILESSISAELLAHILIDKSFVSSERVEYLIQALGISHLKGRELGDNGTNVSGGERERIAMARFLTKEKAVVYLIDEPFTALDAKTEDECLKLLKSELKDKTVFVVSHKFNVIKALSKNCIVLQNGTISQQGSHEYLLKQKGLYKELAECFAAQHSNR